MSAPATAVAKPKFRPRFKARRATAGSSDERSAGSGSAPAPAPAAPPTAPTSPHGAVSQVPPKRTAGRPVAPHGATEAPQQYDTSRGVAAAGGVGRRAGRPTIIRVKRKRTADPVDTLVVQSAVQRVTKSSRTSMDSLAAKFTASTSIEKGAAAAGKAAAAGVPPPAGKVAAPGAGAGAGTGTSAADVGDASSSNTATQAPEHHRYCWSCCLPGFVGNQAPVFLPCVSPFVRAGLCSAVWTLSQSTRQRPTARPRRGCTHASATCIAAALAGGDPARLPQLLRRCSETPRRQPTGRSGAGCEPERRHRLEHAPSSPVLPTCGATNSAPPVVGEPPSPKHALRHDVRGVVCRRYLMLSTLCRTVTRTGATRSSHPCSQRHAKPRPRARM